MLSFFSNGRIGPVVQILTCPADIFTGQSKTKVNSYFLARNLKKKFVNLEIFKNVNKCLMFVMQTKVAIWKMCRYLIAKQKVADLPN